MGMLGADCRGIAEYSFADGLDAYENPEYWLFRHLGEPMANATSWVNLLPSGL